MVRMTFPLYFSTDETLYGIVWYDPLMAAVFTLCSMYICVDYGLEGNLMLYEFVVMMFTQGEAYA